MKSFLHVLLHLDDFKITTWFFFYSYEYIVTDYLLSFCLHSLFTLYSYILKEQLIQFDKHYPSYLFFHTLNVILL